MISHTMPESPYTDMKIIPDFSFVSSYRRTVIFRLFLLRSETALRHRRSLKVDRHISPGKVSVTFRRSVNRFSSKMSRSERGLGPTSVRREDWDLVHQTGLSASRPLWCDVRCVWTTCSVLYGCRSHYRIHFHVDTKIYFQYSVDRLKK